MQFTTTVFALVSVLAASTSAQGYGAAPAYSTPPTYGAPNGTVSAPPVGPTGTGSPVYPPTGGNGTAGNGTVTNPSNPGTTGYEPPSQWGNGAVGRYAGSGLGLVVAGGVVALAL